MDKINTKNIINPLSKQSDRPARQNNPYLKKEKSKKKEKDNSKPKSGVKPLPDGLKFRFDEETQMFQLLLKDGETIVRTIAPDEIDQFIKDFDEKKGLLFDKLI